MKNFSKFDCLKCGVAPAALSIALLAGTPDAQAQAVPPAAVPGATSADTASNEIVVTGTRITNRPDLKSSSPITTVTAETLAVTNTTTAESYLTQMPQFVASITGASNNGANGGATVDLRGLGPARTLVLIDGKRMVPGDIFGPVDIDAIPTGLIKRVDVLTGGASAVYGADAIAGVVNFILDDKFVGARADAGTQVSNYGDGVQTNVNAVIGLKLPNDGHFVVGGQYTKRDGVYESARDYSAVNLDSGSLQPSGSSNAVPTVIDINSGRYQLNSTGTFVPYYQPYNFNPANYLITPLEKYTVMAMFTQPITDSVEMYLRGSYTHSKLVDITAPTATAGFNFTISPTNPFLLANPTNYALIFGDPGNLNPDGTANVGIRRRIVETGGRIQTFTNDIKYIVGGFRGSLGPKFTWEAFGQYGTTDRNETLANDLSYSRTQQAVNAVQGPNGPQCADPSGGCVPVNLFTTTPISAASLAYIEANGHQTNHYEQEVAGGSISGTIDALKSPLATNGAAVAAGVEYRREEGSQAVDAAYGSGDLIYYGQGEPVPSASFDAKEIYGELKMPLVSDKPYLQSLNVEGGVRYSAYKNQTTAGTGSYNALTYKFGGDWTPIDGLRFRAEFNRSIRDPNINELNSPLVQNGTDNLSTDPCALGRPQGNSALAAKCIAQGAPASVVNGGVIQDVIAGQVNILTQGNTALQPEKANTITLGAVFSPPSLPGLHLTVDYYHIKITDYISADNPQDIVNQCFNNNNSAYCALIVRNTINGQLSGSVTAGVVERLINAASLKTSGIDVSTDYKFRFSHENSLTLAIAGTYINSWNFMNGGSVTSCAGHFGNACAFFAQGTGPSGNPMPHWKHIATATYQSGPFSIYGAWRYFGPVTLDAKDTPILVNRIPSYSWFDATVGFEVTKNYALHVGVKNMFNISPPVVGGTAGYAGSNQGNTFPQAYDPLGRMYFVNLSLKY